MYVLIFIYSVCHPLSSLCMSLCMSFFISGVCDSFTFFYHYFSYLGNILEPNQNFSIFFFLFFSPSPNVGTRSHPLPLPCGLILHCHIPCFHFMLCITTVIINTEYINNICIVFYLKSHIYLYWVILSAV